MKKFRLTETPVAWAITQCAAMFVAGWVTAQLVVLAGPENVARTIAPTTILLSVAVAIVIQLWIKLNDLSALTSLTPSERNRLWQRITKKVRALIWLVVFFVAFIFYALATSAIAMTKNPWAIYLLISVGAGYGSSLVQIAGVLVDLSEVAEFRWKVESSEQAARKKERMIGDLRTAESGLESDEKIQGFKRVIGE